eukprot:52070-Pyramimonas_sp.AAC.1
MKFKATGFAASEAAAAALEAIVCYREEEGLFVGLPTVGRGALRGRVLDILRRRAPSALACPAAKARQRPTGRASSEDDLALPRRRGPRLFLARSLAPARAQPSANPARRSNGHGKGQAHPAGRPDSRSDGRLGHPVASGWLIRHPEALGRVRPRRLRPPA